MCIAFVVERPAKPKPKPKPQQPPAKSVEVPAPTPTPPPLGVKYFFDTRKGRYFIQEGTRPQIEYTRLIECPPPCIPPMTIPVPRGVATFAPPSPSPQPAVRKRRKRAPRLLEAPPPRQKDIPWRISRDGGAGLGLRKPDGVGYPTPQDAIDAALASGLEIQNKNVHIMPGRRGGFFVVGLTNV